jgi:diacylglycerol kinase
MPRPPISQANPRYVAEGAMSVSEMPPRTNPSQGQRAKRSWRAKFADAFRGMKLGVRGHSSFFVHFFAAAVVVITAIALRCGWTHWSILILCIGFVLAAEMFNSAIETLFRGLDDKTKARCHQALDISAGAVLLASLVAALVGTIVFVHRLGQLLEWNWSWTGQ